MNVADLSQVLKASLRSSFLTLTAEIELRYPGPQGIGRQKLVCLSNVCKLNYLSEEDEIEEFKVEDRKTS